MCTCALVTACLLALLTAPGAALTALVAAAPGTALAAAGVALAGDVCEDKK